MRKFLLSAIALMMSVAMMAIGLGDGTSKANAIDFDWTNGNVHEATEALWYCVDLAPIDAAAEPALVLYLTNLSDEEAVVDVTVSMAGAQRTLSYTIAAKGYYRLDLPIAQFREFITVDQVNLALQSNQKIALSAKVYEFDEYVKEAIANSEPIDWNSGVKQDALSTKWYEVDITSLKENKEHLQVGFINHETSKKALLTATFVLRGENVTLPLAVPAGFSTTKVIDYQLLAKLPVNRIHVGVTTDSPIEVVTSTKSAIAADPTPCLNAIGVQHGVEYVHAAGATEWYKISLDLLKSEADFSSFYLANKGNGRAHVTLGLVTDCQYTTGTKVTLPIPAGFELGALAPNILGNLIKELTRFEETYNKVDAKDVYLEIVTDQPIHFGLDVTNSITNPCLREDLVSFDWTTGAKVKAGKAVWYDMDIQDVKKAGNHINFTFTNHADSIVWVATVVSVDCPAKVTMPLLVPVPAHASVDQLVDYSIFAAANVDNIYVGVKADGPVELKAEAVNATVVPSAGCENAVVVKSGEVYTQNAGTKWYQFPMSLLDEMGDAAKVSFANLGGQTATLSAGVTVGCEYAIAHRAKVKVPKSVDMSINVPKRIANFARQFVDPSVEKFYLQLTTNQSIEFSVNMQSVDVDACRSAVDFDWVAWEKNGLQLQANQDTWYKVNLDYLFDKLEKGEDLVVNLVNGSEMDVHVIASVSPTCPALLSIEKTVDIPAESDLYKVFTYAEVMKYVGQYDKYIYDGELEILLGQVASYTLYNKLVSVLEKYGYDKYVPFGQIDLLIEAYGDYLTAAGIKELANNYEKYINVAQLKEILKTQMDYVSYNDVVTLLEKYGDYIPYVDAEKILKNYEKYIPYAGGAVALLKKCEKYISYDNLYKLVDRIKAHLPMEELKQLIERLKKYIPENNTCYVNIKTTGELVVKPDDPEPPTPEEPCCPEECEDVPALDWKKVVKLSDITLDQLYKLDITGAYAAKNINFFVNNDLKKDTIVIASEIYKSCQDAAPVAQHSNKVPAGFSMAQVAHDKFAALVDEKQCCMFVMFTAFDTIPVTPDTPVVPPTPECEDIVTDTLICAGETYEWPVNGKVYTEKTQVTLPAATTEGCKFNYILKLDVINGDTLMPVEYAEICEGDVFPWRGLECTEDTTYTVEKSLSCGTATYTLVVTYKDDCGPIVPPAGEDCEDATELNWRNGIRLSQLSAGWYKLDVKDVHANKENVAVKVINDLTCKATVTAAGYAHCEDEDALSEGSKTFKLGESTKTVSYADFADVVPPHVDVVYVNIVSIVENCDPIIPGEDCEDATLLDWRNGIRLSQLSAGWYKLDVKAVHANKESVAVKVINDLTCKATVTAAAYAHCEDEDALSEGSKTFKLGESTKTVSYADFADVVPPHVDVVYVNIVSIVENCDPIIPGEDCEDATELNWRNGIRLSQLSAGWYKLDVKAVHANKENVAVKVINDLTCKATVTAAGYAHCEDEDALSEGSKTFKLGESTKTVSYADFADVVPPHVDVVYVNIVSIVENCDPIIPGEDCEDATELNWRNGIRLSQLSAGWYKLDVKAVHANKENVAVKVINDLTCKATVTAAGYAHCEDEDALYDGSKTFKLGEASKTVAYADFADVVPAHVEYVYVKIASIVEDCEPIEPGEDCEHATELNWRNGVRLSQLSAGWYKLDVKAVHANKESVTAKVINDLTCKATVTAAAYAHCEDEDALYDGSKTFKLGESTKTVAYADFADVVPPHVDVVYVNIVSIVENCDPIIPGEDCEDATLLDWRNGIRLSQLSAGWYKLDVKDVHANKESVTAKVINDLTCKATVTAAAYAHCEDEDALSEGSKTFKLGESTKTVAYADFADVVPAHVEYIYVKIASIVEDCEPIEPGKDCEDATELNWRNGVRLSQLSAGWYKLDVKAVHANKESVTAKVINDLDCEATVVAAAYAHCEDDEALYAGSKTFALGEASKTVAYADFADVVPAHVEYVYVNIASIVENCEPDCEHAEELDWRNGVRLSQLKAGWYKLDVKAVHANKENVAVKVINDLTCKATVTAAGYAHCEDEDALYDGSKTFALGEASKTVSYADFADVVPAHVEYIYVHITDISTACEPECEDVYVEFTAKFCGTYKWNGETFTEAGDYVREFALETGCKFIVTLHLIEDCEPCADWTEIDWRAGIKLSQLTEGGKYKLNVASVHAGKADVTVAVDNDLECKATVAATAKAYCEDDEVLIDGSNPFELGVTEHVIKYAEFADVVAPHVEYLYVQVTSIVEECEVEKDTVINTVTEFICDGTEYVDVTGEKHVVSSLIDPALLTWSVTTETETTVTIYNYVITPIVAPVVMTAEVLATIPGATPVLEAGKKVDVTGTLEAIKNYYDMNDTEAIADVETVVWAAGADATLACDAESHTMILALTSGCEFKWTAELTFDVTPVDVKNTTETATICEGETYPWGDEFLSETGTYPLEVKNEAGCVVEIKTLELTVTPAEEVEETVAACDSYEWHGTTYTKSGDYTYTENCRKEILHLTINTTEVVEETVAACDSYEWHGTTYTKSGDYTYTENCRKEILHLTINTTEVVEETVAACDSYEWHGTTYTTSGDYSYEADCRKEILHLTINTTEVVEETVAACDSYEWHGTTYTTSGDYSYEADCRKEILHLTINTTEVVEETVAACESYEWYGTTYTTSGDYTFEADCRKEILHLTINTAAAEDTTVTECYAYTWNGETYTESGDYTYNTTAANGCDSIVTLHLTITAETPETTPTLGGAVAVAKYGNRMVVLHLNGFAEKYGWTPAGDQVTWYQVVGEMDNSWNIVDDEVLGSGMYIENLNGFAGEIYAIIDASDADACGNLYRTKVLVLAAAGQAPKLMPTIAQPSETLHLTNLNPENVTEVRVYSTSGELMATYNAEQASEFIFKAATLPGYYMVEVQNNGEQTTLRYIVK